MASNPIPTPHSGVTFRSRLEARHAFFMDQLGVKWEYEPQGWDTDGEWYLPDFAIFGALGLIWAEIKPAWDNDPAGIERWKRFADQRPQPSRAALFVGLPDAEMDIIVIGGDELADDPGLGPWEDDGQQWRPCPSGLHFDLAFPGRYRSKFAADMCEDRFGGLGEERIADAAAKAKSAKFSERTPPGLGTGAAA